MTPSRSRHGLRRWILIAAAVMIAFELVYVTAANVMLRTDLLSGLINKKPEKMLIQWESASTWLPGVVHVKGFSLRNQSKKVQIYLTLERVTGVISLSKLPFKTFHLRSANASNVDFRLRTRLDAPRKNATAEGQPPQPIPGVEFYPDIPGYDNPPDPKPEDLYPRKKKKSASPWTLSFDGIDVEGTIQVAINQIRLEADGSVKGSMNYKLRDAIHIRRAKLDVINARLLVDSESASENLELRVNSKWRPFPAKGAKLPEIIKGISGNFTIRGNLLPRGSRTATILPGLTARGTGSVDTTLQLEHGVLQPGSSYSLVSEDMNVSIMDLTAIGTAEVSGETTKEDGSAVSNITIEFDDYSMVDPENSDVGVEGSGLTVDVSWVDLALYGGTAPRSAVIVLPRSEIRDVGVLAQLIPPQDTAAIRSGMGQVEANLSVDDAGMASGRMVLDAEAITVDVKGEPLRADLAVRANLHEGDLGAARFAISDTTITLDNVVALEPNTKKPMEPWWTSVDIKQGTVVFKKPLTAKGMVQVKMYDTRAVVALIKSFTKPPKWISLMPNVKNVDGSLKLDMGDQFTNVDDVQIVGDRLQMFGWLHLQQKNGNGRIYVKYKGLDTGISITDGKGKLHVSKPRQWFEGETGVTLPD